MEIITLPRYKIEEELLESAKTRTLEENQVIIHVQIFDDESPTGIRLWPSTFLIDREGGHRAKLLYMEGISAAPHWTYMREKHSFTLVFEGLPKDCNVFDLIEDIPTSFRFEYLGISRNSSDVYHLSMYI
jgi:hypothetical protein